MSGPQFTCTVPSPFGTLAVTEQEGAIVALDWRDAPREDDTPLLQRAKAQLGEYFDKKRQSFDLPLKPRGNEFQQSVCQAMLAIPYGETVTYGDIAEQLGTYGQPVGKACGANTIPIIIPCHRVLGTNWLGGYSGEGGVERKIALLKHEDGFPYLI